jgi:hypothetical protein
LRFRRKAVDSEKELANESIGDFGLRDVGFRGFGEKILGFIQKYRGFEHKFRHFIKEILGFVQGGRDIRICLLRR